jgi:SOS-response transcriptional repressor LexA
MDNESLTITESKVLEVIKSYFTKTSYPPLMKDIMRVANLNEYTVRKDIGQLKTKGFITYEKGKFRTVRVLKNTYKIDE